MLLLVSKRLNEMIAENDIQQGLKGKMITINRAQIQNVFEQENTDNWSCYDGMISERETDVDCGGDCVNGCMLQQRCHSNQDCVEGLFCTKGSCIDRSIHLYYSWINR